jgi:hypothetical protein
MKLSASPEQTLRAPPARPGDPPSRRIALIAGVLFVITFVTSIPALLLYDPVLNDTGYITAAGGETQVLLAAFLELLLIVANIGTAVVLFRSSSARANPPRLVLSPPASSNPPSSPPASSACWPW